MKTRARVAVVQTVGHPEPDGFLNQVLQLQMRKSYILLSVGFPAEDAQVPDIANGGLSGSLSNKTRQ